MISADGTAVDWDAAGVDEVTQNVRMLLSLDEGEQPLGRSLGMTRDEIDGRINIAGARLRAEVARKIPRAEPRAKVRRVRIEAGTDITQGQLRPVVEIEAAL